MRVNEGGRGARNDRAPLLWQGSADDKTSDYVSRAVEADAKSAQDSNSKSIENEVVGD